MDVLNQILRQPIDPDYAAVAADPERRSRAGSRRLVVLVAVLSGLLFTWSAIQTTSRAPALAQERGELIDRIHAEETRQDALRGRIDSLRLENDRMRSERLVGDEAAKETQATIRELAPGVASAAVQGPGLVITVDDAPTKDAPTKGDADGLNRVFDRDLQALVNGLWESGAEAIAINGHRLSALTAIRGAGDAITVDYRSLTRPYRIEAIGDPERLEAGFGQTSGGRLWSGLQRNYKMRYEIGSAGNLELASDPGIVLRHARRGE